LLGSRRLTIAKDLRFCLLFMQSFRFILVIISFLIFVDARICVRDIATVVIPIYKLKKINTRFFFNISSNRFKKGNFIIKIFNAYSFA